MNAPKTPDPLILSDLVRRIVETVHPLRIILFGSAARGEMNENSDLDVLVIMPDGVHLRRTEHEIYRGLRGLGFAKDVVVATPSDIQKYGQDPSLVLYPVRRGNGCLVRKAIWRSPNCRCRRTYSTRICAFIRNRRRKKR